MTAVLVTGAQQGIGRAMALAFARAGADVGVNYLDDKAAAERVAGEVRALGGKSVVIQGDVASVGAAQAMVDAGLAKNPKSLWLLMLRQRLRIAAGAPGDAIDPDILNATDEFTREFVASETEFKDGNFDAAATHLAAADRPTYWAWAFHGPPEGPLSWTGAKHYGDPELPRLLDAYNPDVVLCGHIHQAPFVAQGGWAEQRGQTWLFNAGFQLGNRPTSIELDLDARTAAWPCPPFQALLSLFLACPSRPSPRPIPSQDAPSFRQPATAHA